MITSFVFLPHQWHLKCGPTSHPDPETCQRCICNDGFGGYECLFYATSFRLQLELPSDFLTRATDIWKDFKKYLPMEFQVLTRIPFSFFEVHRIDQDSEGRFFAYCKLLAGTSQEQTRLTDLAKQKLTNSKQAAEMLSGLLFAPFLGAWYLV